MVMKILINAYACSPDMGSEPGMAWNWCRHLAKHCELHIITEGEFKKKIEAVLPELSQSKNMHFYYNPVSENIRSMCWNQGDWRFYKYYKEWQWKTYLIGKRICEEKRIDVLHQLNMIGFREPGYLWKLSKETGIPFVWGPVDAKDKFPMAYADDANIKTKAFLWLKNAITCWQLRHSKRVREAAATGVVFSASSNSVRSFEKYMHICSPLINETGCTMIPNNVDKTKNTSTFDILWVGKMDFRKQLGLAIKAVAKVAQSDICFHIVGSGDCTPYKQLAKEQGIGSQCVWHGVVSHNAVQQLMRQCDLFLFTSVAEGTPHVVLEAIANHLPILCFDTCGQGDVVNETVGVKIPLTNPSQSAEDLAKKLTYLHDHRECLESMSANCSKRQAELSWDKKAETMVRCYTKIRHKQ